MAISLWRCERRRKMTKTIYFCVLAYCILVGTTLFMDMKYPYQVYNLFDKELNVSIEQKRKWNVVKKRYDFKQDDKTKYCDVYNVSRPYTADYECVQTRTSPSTTVCLYNEFSDMFISHDIKHTGQWEPHVLKDFQSVLNRNHDIGVIDLGANIGFYSLIAAKMGHRVIAVEPYYPSIYRIHRAIDIEKLDNLITVVHNAISDRRLTGTIRISGDNQGDTRVDMEYHECNGNCPSPVKTILMDDLLEVIDFNKTVIKMDIQGYEVQAMTHADKILQNLDVPYIFMEWGLMGQYYGDKNYTSGDKFRVQAMIRKLFDWDYRPYTLSSDGSKPLNPEHWHKWPFDIIWIKLLDPEEYEALLRTHFINWP